MFNAYSFKVSYYLKSSLGIDQPSKKNRNENGIYKMNRIKSFSLYINTDLRYKYKFNYD